MRCLTVKLTKFHMPLSPKSTTKEIGCAVTCMTDR